MSKLYNGKEDFRGRRRGIMKDYTRPPSIKEMRAGFKIFEENQRKKRKNSILFKGNEFKFGKLTSEDINE